MSRKNVPWEKSRKEHLRKVGYGEVYSYRRFDGFCPDCGINDRHRSQSYCKPCRAKRARDLRLNKKLESKG